MNFERGRSERVARCADLLARAEADRRPIEALTVQFPDLDVEDAYRVQQANVQRRLARGERIVGHKIGLTAKAMQELFKVGEPDYGHLLDTMMHPAGETLALGQLVDPQVEVEPAFVLGRRLQGPGVTEEDVLAATECVMVCLEVIDSRILGWKIRLPDTVADNGSSARVVLGTRRVPPRGLDLGDLATELVLDGEVVETGNTSAILGHPARSIAWLTNRLADFGVAFEPGHVVLPGTCTRSVRISGRREARGRIAGLGEVALPLSGRSAAA